MTLFCAFCEDLATYTYRGDGMRVGFCRWHIVFLYLGLHYIVSE